MKKYSTLLFSSALILASLAHAPKVVAYSSYERLQHTQQTAPTEVQQALIPQLNGQELSISYQRTSSQRGKVILYAIWSEENGQDDLQWHTAGESQTTISLKNATSYGNYLIHAYIMVDNRLTFLSESHFTLETPTASQTTATAPASQVTPSTTEQAESSASSSGKANQATPTQPSQATPAQPTPAPQPQVLSPSVSASVTKPGFMDIRVTNVPSTVTEVLLPVWSTNNGQDDIIWYTATKNADGSYSYQVDLSKHKFDTGVYAVHVYGRERNKASLTGLTGTELTVTQEQIPATPDPKISITSLNTSNGTYQVQITPQAGGKTIQKIDVATWSTSNQSNIKWRVASYQNGVYTTNVDFSEHQSINGVYQNHVYITYTDGSRVGYVANPVNLTSSRAPLKVTTTFSSQGNFRVSIDNLYSSGNVSYAVWSDENGQDDIRWYNASKTGDRSYTGDIPLHFHKGTGTYHLHVYQNGKGVIPTTFQVTASQRPAPKPVIREANTYPVGYCTWGAKELAPWVPNWMGNANQWLNSAREKNLSIGTTPRVGAIAVWLDGQYGHVAVVTAVESNTRIRVKESNFNGNMTINDYRGWFNPIANRIAGYIYPD